MALLQLVPVILSLLLLAAHFLRGGHLGLVGVVLLVLASLAIRRHWVARLVQVVLGVGAIVWLLTLVDLIPGRLQAGQPVGRLVVILGSVAVLTGLSALVFRTDRLRRTYRRGGGRPASPSPP